MAKVRSMNAIWVLTVSWLVIAAGTTYAQTTVDGVRSDEDTIGMSHVNPLLLCPSTLLCRGVCREACNLQVIVQQIALATKGTAPGVDIRSAAAKMFTPDAAFVATPVAAFKDGLVAFEYFLTFSRQPAPNVPPAVVNLTGVEVRDIIVSGSTVTNVYDLLVASPFDPNKKARLRGWSMAAFNAASLITYQTIIYPLWEEVMTTLGLVELFANPKVSASVADQVCIAHESFCTGDNKKYDNKEDCVSFMLALRPPPVHRLAGNNLLCRLFHARYLDFFPEAHCPHIGPTGGGQCTEDLPFTIDKINALLPRPAFYSVNTLLQADINRTAGF